MDAVDIEVVVNRRISFHDTSLPLKSVIIAENIAAEQPTTID